MSFSSLPGQVMPNIGVPAIASAGPHIPPLNLNFQGLPSNQVFHTTPVTVPSQVGEPLYAGFPFMGPECLHVYYSPYLSNQSDFILRQCRRRPARSFEDT